MRKKAKLLHQLLAEAAESFPDQCAVNISGDSVTYQELDHQSSQLANLLFQLNLTKGDVAGVLLEKSVAAVIGYWGVLKAGGAYIPLDLSYATVSRVSGIITNSKMRYLITTTGLWDAVKENLSERQLMVVLVDEATVLSIEHRGCRDIYDKKDLPKELVETVQMTGDEPAYILYTSGSTGIPKGVTLTHKNALSFVGWAVNFFHLNDQDRVANHAPLHFDLSVFDLYAATAAGAQVHMVPTAIAGNPRALCQWIEEAKVSIWYSVPSVWISMIKYADIQSEKMTCLKKILFAGEVFPARYLRQLMLILPERQYFNLYGPTETNVCMVHQVKHPDEIKERPVALGLPCDHLDVVVLNKIMTPLKNGEKGEVFVYGEAVTSGYYNDDLKSKNAFLSLNPHSSTPVNYYKTGDIVRKREDGLYEYVGRKDLMVKCSGFRIELEEIEKAAVDIIGISESVAVPIYDDDRGTVKIELFVTLSDEAFFSSLMIKKSLSRTLPVYMIPETIVAVEAIPKNVNGKIDRKQVEIGNIKPVIIRTDTELIC